MDTTASEPEEEAARAWVRAVVRTALSTIPALERQALHLAYDEGLTQVEIAERLGWPLGTVKTRTRRALVTLRAALDGVPDLGARRPDTGRRTGRAPCTAVIDWGPDAAR